jgi:hypothetical protein
MLRCAKASVCLATIVTAITLLVSPDSSYAEESEGEDGRKQALTLTVGGVYVPEGVSEEDADVQGTWVGTIGFGYTHRVRESWSLGAVVEIELDDYLIEDKELNRENPVVVAGLAYLETLPGLEFYAGGGVELETDESLALLRIGFAYEFLIKELWIIAPTLFWDITTEYTKLAVAAEFGRWF